MRVPAFAAFAVIAAIVVVAACAAGSALAQSAPSLDGKWRGSFTDMRGRTRQAEFMLSGQGGTWVYEREGGKWDNACMGPEFPIVVLASGPDELSFRIDGEKIIKGCGERVVTLKPGADGATLTGAFKDNGHDVKLTRR